MNKLLVAGAVIVAGVIGFKYGSDLTVKAVTKVAESNVDKDRVARRESIYANYMNDKNKGE